ncbi:chorismate pyruvate-lyase family protein [Methanobrevibacter sp.]|uniref:chorismate pyruvate-lyase family protein n=1 Tax=Methanobrevibacter sp. TaxID=66852 RepID=UPI00388CFC34
MEPKCNIIENEIRETITELEEEHNLKLSTTQKILLTINGPVTPILDVLYGEVRLFMLEQHFEKADKTVADLVGINEGDDVLYRNAIVFKRRQPLIYVVSYIPKERCTDEIADELLKGKLTTGKIIDKHNIETVRKINKIRIEKATPILTELFKTTEDMLTREYVLMNKKNVVIWTKESYPLSYFKI